MTSENGKKDKWIYYILIRAGMKFRNKKKFRYDILAHFEHCFKESRMAVKSKVVLKKRIFIEKCNKAAYKKSIVTHLCVTTKGAKLFCYAVWKYMYISVRS
jgi:hypothetical protein